MIDRDSRLPLGLDGRVEVWADPQRKLSLVAQPGVSDECISLIEQTRFGGDGLSYRRLGVRDHIQRLGTCVSLSLFQQAVLVGTYLMNPLDLRIGSHTVNGVYRSTLCVAAQFQRRGMGRLIVEHALGWLDQRAVLEQTPTISFGCIERKNTASMRLLVQAGSLDLGHVSTQMVYRQWPRRKLNIVRLDASSKHVKAARSQAERDCSVAYAGPQQRDYFAVMEDSAIVAGACINKCSIDFNRIGQPWDFLARHLFAHVGPARRRFNPRNFTYLRFDAVVAAPECGDVFKDFLSTLLAQEQTHMAMFALDPRAQISQRLESAGVFGRVATATRQELAVMACHHGASRTWPAELESAATRAPLAVGPFGQ